MPSQLKYEQEEIFRPSIRKWVLVVLGSAAFVGCGVVILMHADEWSETVLGYACIGFFGLCGIAGLVQFVPGCSFLRLTSEGITFRTMWRGKSIRWSDIERFGVAEFTTPVPGATPRRHRLVGFDYSASYPGRERALKLRSFNRNLTGFEAALPDNYGWKHAELAAHLNALRERYVSATGGV